MDVLQTPSRPLGSALSYLRRRYRVSQDELASRANLARSTIVNLEKHRTRRPNASTLNQLAAAFGLSREQLDAELGLLPFGKRVSQDTHTPQSAADASLAGLTQREQRMIMVFRDLPGVQQHLFEGLLLYYHGLRYLPEWPQIAAAYGGAVAGKASAMGVVP